MPYETTDAHGRRLTIAPAPLHAGPRVELQADDTAIGGETVSVWLTEDAAREFAAALSVSSDRYRHADIAGDQLEMARADDWTTFTLTREPRDEHEEVETVRVLILTARLPEVRAAILDSLPATEEPAAEPEPAEGDTPSTPAPRWFRRRPLAPVHAAQWHRDGDHPKVQPHDGNPAYDCGYCNAPMDTHGEIPLAEGGCLIVCPADWIVTEADGSLDDRYRPEQFAAEYEPVPTAPPAPANPAARRVLTDDEYDATYMAARRAIGANAAHRAGNDTVYGVIDAALAAVGILAPPPMPDDETCTALFADEFGTWHQCAEEPGHDGDGHDSGEWSWPYAAPDSIPPGGTAPAPVAPTTERAHWQTIADALNAAHHAGMPVGIDLDGTLADHRAWSVVWDRAAERWTVAGYDDEPAPAEDVTDGEAPPVDRVTVDRTAVEIALRHWLERFDYDAHKYTECSEDTGTDRYPEEAGEFFAALVAALAVEQHDPADDHDGMTTGDQLHTADELREQAETGEARMDARDTE